MNKKIDYERFFNDMLNSIAISRNPQVERTEDSYFGVSEHISDSFFDFGLNSLENNLNVIKNARKSSYYCVARILSEILKSSEIIHQVRFDIVNKTKFSPIEFAIYDMKASIVYFFKDVEKDFFWTSDQKDILISQELKESLKKSKIKEYKFVYLSFDESQRQVLNSNNNLPLATIKDFFERYSSIEEFERFSVALRRYIEKVNECIDCIQLKTLTSSANLNFKRLVRERLESFDAFEILLTSNIFDDVQVKCMKTEYDFLKTHFIDEEFSSIIYGSMDFAESLLTAEWLYISLKKARAVDLSIIGICYFKAVEQLMYRIMSINTNKGYKFKMNSKSQLVVLTEETLNDKITIGAMAQFIKYSLAQSFYEELKEVKNPIINIILEYADLRNKYSHKLNIHDWDKIIEIRNKTLAVFFFLLASINYSDDEKEKFEIRINHNRTEYEKLCEYLDYHRNQLFIFEYQDGIENMGISCIDTQAKLINDNYVEYSGAYFKRLGGKEKLFLSEQNLPRTIYIGRVDIKYDSSSGFKIDTKKLRKIFDDGVFCGSSVVEENHNSY